MSDHSTPHDDYVHEETWLAIRINNLDNKPICIHHESFFISFPFWVKKIPFYEQTVEEDFTISDLKWKKEKGHIIDLYSSELIRVYLFCSTYFGCRVYANTAHSNDVTQPNLMQNMPKWLPLCLKKFLLNNAKINLLRTDGKSKSCRLPIEFIENQIKKCEDAHGRSNSHF